MPSTPPNDEQDQDEAMEHESTTHVPHTGRAGHPVATQMREAFKIGHDEALYAECLDLCAVIARSLRDGSYGIDPAADRHDRPLLRSLTGADLPLLSVQFALRDDNSHDGEGLKAEDVAWAIDPSWARFSHRANSSHRLAVPAVVRAIADGRIMQPDVPGWRATLRLPTPWSPATIESFAPDTNGTDFVVCGPEADPLPTECRLMTRRRPGPGSRQQWLWTLVTQIIHFDAKRLPDAVETLRILADRQETTQ
jgi:hypothetical protein